MLTKVSLDRGYIRQAVLQKTPISVYLTNGIKLEGILLDEDVYTVQLQGHGSQLIYKHAISTIMSREAIQFKDTDNLDKDQSKQMERME